MATVTRMSTSISQESIFNQSTVNEETLESNELRSLVSGNQSIATNLFKGIEMTQVIGKQYTPHNQYEKGEVTEYFRTVSS